MFQKYFIAIVPPEHLLSQIQDLKKSIYEEYGTKGALRSPGHITLHMPFSWEEDKEDKLISSLQNFSFEKEFQIILSGFSCFEPRVVFINVLENDLLSQMQHQLVKYVKQNLQLFNQADDMRGFHPHVTVAFRDLKKPLFYKMWEEYKNKIFDATFTCNDICLLKQVDDKWEVYRTFTIVK